MTAQSSYGGEFSFGPSIEIEDAAPDPQLTVTSTGTQSVSDDPANSTDPWEIYGYDIDFGDGYSTGTIDAGSAQNIEVYNNSTGTTDLSMDVLRYFASA